MRPIWRKAGSGQPMETAPHRPESDKKADKANQSMVPSLHQQRDEKQTDVA